jgi:hypothetical protein
VELEEVYGNDLQLDFYDGGSVLNG